MAKNPQKASVPAPLYDLTHKFMKHKVSRREFLARTAAMGMTIPALSALLTACAATTPESAGTGEAGTGSSGPLATAADIEALVKEKFSGESLNISWEAGLQAQGPLLFSGPLFEEKTGVKINTIEVDDLYQKHITEHIAGTGAFDVINYIPAWTSDFVSAGILEPLDDYAAMYLPEGYLEDYADLYRDMGTYEGARYGFYDDGDTLLLYYRSDLFEEHGTEFEEQLGYPLAPPTNYREFDEIARFFTEKLAPEVYGAAWGRGGGDFGMFIHHFKANGGRFFDPDSMEALINGPEGLRTVQEMVASNQWMPPGIETQTPFDTFSAWQAGNFAMTWFWPPLGRWSAGYLTGTEQLSFVPESQVAGKVGYSLFPGDITQHQAGFVLSVSSDSPRKELAYLFAQWLASPEISLQRVMLPFALRDPYRKSHFESSEYRALWGEADQYLDKLLEAGQKVSLELIMPGAEEYHNTLNQMLTGAYAGEDPQTLLDNAAQAFEEITDRLGRENQQRAYAAYLDLGGAYPSANLVDAPSNLELY